MDISDTTLAALCLPWATTGGGGESEVSLSQRVSASAPPFSPFWTSSTGNPTDIARVAHGSAPVDSSRIVQAGGLPDRIKLSGTDCSGE